MLPELISALKPLKDLAANWDIDISSSIDEYLEELGHETISFDGGETTMNFAQAALLVQSCTCIYSKKVEYIHSLVYQVLDLITNKSKQRLKSSVDKDGNDEDADFHDDDNDDDFLSLDDIPEGKNIYMKEDFEEGEKFQLLPQIPMCLISLEEDEKGDNPLLSKTGELLASRKDFKLNTCHIHSSGTLLLDLSHLELLEKSLKRTGTQADKISDVVLEELTEARNVQETSGQNDDPADDFPCIDEGSCDFDQPDAAPEEQIDMAVDAMCGSEGRTKDVILEKKSKKKKHVVDPLQLLDINEEVDPPRPFVRGKNIIKLCPGIEDESRKRKRTKIIPKIEPVKDFIARRCFQKKIPKHILKECDVIQEFEQQYFKEFKRRKALEREWAKKRREEGILDEESDNEDDEQLELVEPEDVADELEGYNDDPLDDDFLKDVDIGADAGHIGLDQGQALTDEFEDCVVDSYEDLVRKHVEEYMSSAQEYAQIMDLSRRVSEWEDKIIPRLQEEDSRDPFDINKYGSDVISELDQGKSVRFHQVVQGKPHFEICRTFLSTLLLANSENVKIKEMGSLEVGMDKFEIELLSSKRHFEELQEYQAPSRGSKGD